MSYTKTFIEDYFYQEKEIYNPVSIKYMIYNLKTKQFRSSNTSSIDETCEYILEILSTELDFTIFISHPIEEEYFFIDLF